MRLFTAGSAPLLPQTFDEFKHRTGHTIVERYGMTETGMNTSNPLKGARKAGTVGLPLQGVSCKIIDSAGNPMEINETGSLLVKGPNVFSGYWQLPEKTQEEFTADGYFRTGDLACRDEDGYISIVGRGKDLIITGGFNVYPREVENVIDKMHGVDESAVIGLPHSDYGEAVTAIIVRSEGSDIDEKAIIQHLKATLANFKVAKQVLFVDTLPRNTMGKVQKNVLREQFKQ
jgi:malonyl-CoA/methylmalonyl-CoA synthetase